MRERAKNKKTEKHTHSYFATDFEAVREESQVPVQRPHPEPS